MASMLDYHFCLFATAVVLILNDPNSNLLFLPVIGIVV